MNKSGFQFHRLDLHWKLMITGFLIIFSSGYIAAVLNATLSVGITPQAIADHYSDKTLSIAEQTMIEKQGFVEEEFSLEDVEEVEEFSNGGIKPSNQMMHMSGDMMHNMSDTESSASHSTQGDDTLSAQILAQVSHVHLLVFSLLFFLLASLLCLTQLGNIVKTYGVILLFAGLWGDIISLNLVRFVSAQYSWLTMAMGTLIGISFAFIIFRVFWELWFSRNIEFDKN